MDVACLVCIGPLWHGPPRQDLGVHRVHKVCSSMYARDNIGYGVCYALNGAG